MWCQRLLCAIVAIVVLSPCATGYAGWGRPAGGESSRGPEVVFTFDDGPHEVFTKSVLDTLDEFQIKGIFFWVGRRVASGNQREPRLALIKRAVQGGHLVANHTVNHIHLCQTTTETAIKEIEAAGTLFANLSGLPMQLFRAPYGDHCASLVKLIADRKLTHLYWDIDPQEWKHGSPKRAAYYVISRLKRLTKRAVILMHDTKYATAKALPRILRWLRRENWRRKRKGQQPIRVLSGSDLIEELWNPQALRWFATVGRDYAAQLHRALHTLLPWPNTPIHK